MDLRQLEYIIAIAEEKNISRAAEKLYISQPTLSQYLSRLEQELGIKLFNHIKNAFTLTDAGKIYVEGAKQILNIKKDIYKRIEDVIDSKKRHISLGITPERGARMLSEILPKFYENHSNMEIQVVEEYANELASLTHKGLLDIAISVIDKNDQALDYEFLCKEEIVLVVPKTHKMSYLSVDIPFGSTKETDISLFQYDYFVLMNPSTRIRGIVDSFFETVKIKPNIFLEVQQISLVCNIVSKGMAVGFIPKSFMIPDPNIVYFSVVPKINWELGAIYPKGAYLTKATRDFIELTKEYLNSQLKFEGENNI